MNEIESEFNAEIVEILVENGTPVEFGQVLMRVKQSWIVSPVSYTHLRAHET